MAKIILDKIKKITQAYWVFFIDLLFPIECLGCGKEGEWLCLQCYNRIALNKRQYCLKCKKENIYGKYCRECGKDHHLDGALIASSYDDQTLKLMVKSLKYNLVKDIARELGRLLVLFINSKIKELGSGEGGHSLFKDLTQVIVIPVPLHKKRLNWRGFNQAELIAEEISKHFNLPIQKDLIRIKENKIQAKLKEKERYENVKGCFSWAGGNLKGKKIILIDDVLTTGATLNECARILKSAGADEVWGIVVAKG